MESMSQLAWLIAAVCFILSLGGLSQHTTARYGNMLGIVGMMLAILAALFSDKIGGGYVLLILALIVGGVAGSILATRVEMTAMPQLVAILHSFVGLAAVLVGLSVFLADWHLTEVTDETSKGVAAMIGPDLIHRIEIFVGVFIGGLTFTGSIIAWGKTGWKNQQHAADDSWSALDQSGDVNRLRVAGLGVPAGRRVRKHVDGAATDAGDLICFWSSSGDGDWRCRHASRGVDAQ